MTAARLRLRILLEGARGQAMAESSSLVFFMLGALILSGGSSVMKSLIESLSAYFLAHYFPLQFPM